MHISLHTGRDPGPGSMLRRRRPEMISIEKPAKKLEAPEKTLSKTGLAFPALQIFCENATKNFLVSSSAIWKYFSHMVFTAMEFDTGGTPCREK